MRKIFSLLILLMYILWCIIGIVGPTVTNSSAAPWTRERALHLARSTLFDPDPGMVDILFAAGSASAAVDLLFPDAIGPDRSAYESALTAYTSSGFNWSDQNHAARLYQMKYVLDPYEAKRKLFSLFEDIYSVNVNGSSITYKDGVDQHDLIYSLMFGNYQIFVKRLLYNNGNPGDYAQGESLNLLNQIDPKNPNENYARELMQLFMMGEYEPFESAEKGDPRNYEESDIRSLARILTGYRSDTMTHAVTLDTKYHYGGNVSYLPGDLPDGVSFPFYSTLTGTIDTVAILDPVNGNNGLSDNIIEYIFAKRSHQIALFLADRIYRFYIQDTPTRSELDSMAAIILANNFEMLPSIRSILSLDLMYSDTAMNAIRYKNPLELYVGTLKRIRDNNMTGMLRDPNLYDTSILRRLNWSPYFPGSVFGRDGFDDSRKWNNAGIQNGWMNITNYFTYRTTGTGVIDYRLPLGDYRKILTTETVPVMTNISNAYSGILILQSATFTIDSVSGIQEPSSIPSSTMSTDRDIGPYEGMIHSPDMSERAVMENFGEPYATDLSRESPMELQAKESSSVQSLPESIPMSMGEDIGSLQTDVAPIAPEELTLMSANDDVLGAVEIMPDIIAVSIAEGGTGTDIIPAVDTLSSGEYAVSLESVVPQVSGISLTNGTVIFPRFEIATSSGNIVIYSGSYSAQTRTLRIFSGALVNGKERVYISNGTCIFTPESYLIADVLIPEQIYDTYERYILDDLRLPLDVRSEALRFIQFDGSGNTLSLSPTNTQYYNTVIRGLLSFLLAQPEYTLLHGSTLPTSTDTPDQKLIENAAGKIIFIELYGGNDYLSSIIPKDEYDIYRSYRTNSTGSSAITGSGLVDIGNFYMNSALAYSSSGAPTFKALYDNGSLKLFNRVGAPSHSQDHDKAAKQISSYGSTTLGTAHGVFGELIQREFDSMHTISLGAKYPGVYRGGRYVNMGGDLIVTNLLDSKNTAHIDLINRVSRYRSYPGNTGDMYRNAVKISETGKLSKSQGGPSGATGDMNSVFGFLRILLANNIGRSYYMGGRGGYDTHNLQFTTLNQNLQFVSESVTRFFDEVKNTQDVTIVIFSEFGRTARTNGDLGTDHGDGGGMYVISSNQKLLQSLDAPIYGNMALRYARSGLGVGIDYRSVYSKVYNALYGIDGKSFFHIDTTLEKDVSLEKNTISLLSYAYRATGTNSVSADVQFSVTGANYSPTMAGYTLVTTGTGRESQKSISIRSVQKDGYSRVNFTLSSITQPYYTITSLSNQYVPVELTGMLTGASLPIILKNTEKTISYTGTSILPIFANTSVPAVLAGSGMILSASGNTIVRLPVQDFEIRFATGSTRVISMTSSSGKLIWNGGFILGEQLDRDLFVPGTLSLNGESRNISKSDIYRLNKIGADTLGVGMKLSQNIELAFTNIMSSGSFRVITSDDGVNWSDIEFPGRTYQKDLSNALSFSTNHFSYFALLSVGPSIVLLPGCTIASSPSAVLNGSGTTLTWNMANSLTGLISPINMLVAVSGSTFTIPGANSTTNYTLTVTNPSGSSSCMTSVITSSGAVVPVPDPIPNPIPNPSPTPIAAGAGSGPGGAIAVGSHIPTKDVLSIARPMMGVDIPDRKISVCTRRTPSTVLMASTGESQQTRYVDIEHRLTLRSTPALTQDNAVTFLPRNMAVTVLSDSGDWSYVDADGWRGYLKSDSLRGRKREDDIRSGLISVLDGQRGYISVAQSLYIRSQPSVFSRIQGVLYRGQDVTVLDRIGNWIEVATPYVRGYIHTSYLK